MHAEPNGKKRSLLSRIAGGCLGGVAGAVAGVIVILVAWAGSSGGHGRSVGPLFNWLFVETCFFIFGIGLGLFTATISLWGRSGIGAIIGFGAGLIVVCLTDRILAAIHFSESEQDEFRQLACIACLACVGFGMIFSTVRPRS